MNPSIFREYDIRGVAARDLTDTLAFDIGRAMATRLGSEGGRRICVGRDVRESSPRLQQQVCDGVRAGGLDVLDVGIVPTPVLYYSIVANRTDGGVMITGSHNPIEYNGFKLCRGTSPIWGAEIRTLETMMRAGDFAAGKGGYEQREVLEDYRAMVRDRLTSERRLSIVVDAGNGTGGLIGPEVLADQGHEVETLYCEPDGRFPNHLPDPTVPEYMRDLAARVCEIGADLGVGYDGDADRIGLIDEQGRMIFGDQILALFARELLARHPGSRILFDVKCSQGLEEDIRTHGGEPIMWKTGHSLLKAKMREEEIPLAGEMSGHMFFQEGYFGFDDAIYGSARMAAYLSRLTEPLSVQIDRIPFYVNSPEIRVSCADEAKFRIVEEVSEHFQRDHEVITIDGARVLFGEGWGLLRASNTQPVLVLRFEAQTPEALAAIEGTFREILARYPEVTWTA
ncbi:MAG: phosphomannomutase/phosphoglucomutase [Candidatus Eisenbacteria sp.]|nr:phosphomannomutase/phosphoglucomutase [Candidatus Eisenbacteria bacterium]